MAQTKGVDYAAQKQRFLKEYVDGWTGSLAELAAKHGLNKITGYRWAAASKKKAKRTSKASKKKRRARPALVARNGRVSVPPPRAALAHPPRLAVSLESVRAQLLEALQSVDQLRAAYRTVFGGPA